ncbi:MAG TPA: YceI family protein [Acidimicrobiales bacterium]|nr:YceI family protein [Acidimicrobiales bacterium]
MSTNTKTQQVQVPGYVSGTWQLDPVHTDVSFTVRHMMVSKVRGKFHGVTGTIVLAEHPLDSTVSADVDLSTIDTGNAQRDDHIRSADFFGVETHKTMSFRSTSVTPTDDGFAVAGELTLHGVTRPVTLGLEVNGFTKDPYGGTRSGFTATTTINRKDFGITIDMPMDGGGAVIGDKVQVLLEIEAVLDQEPAVLQA